ncbi:MAG: DHA2 family efflux MFS transporter permease subunit [Antricoccus sp.]
MAIAESESLDTRPRHGADGVATDHHRAARHASDKPQGAHQGHTLEKSLRSDGSERSPWLALIALCIGFFMILVDQTIVAVAIDNLKTQLNASYDAVIWVQSAYLLAFAVPLLITGRLGDQVGPKRMYITGLTVFTLSSLACGLSGSIEMLIIFRVIQGLGASMMTPQTMSIITRTFAPDRRGAAMGFWGAIAGVATLIGPLAGGVIVGSFGWEWIFFVNVPIGVVGFVLAWKLVPNLETKSHKYDIPGILLSVIGMFLLVFGIQEGQQLNWDWRIWTLIVVGAAVMVAFVLSQRRGIAEPLVPLRLFRERNFSLANISICVMGFAITGIMIPYMLYAQTAKGLTPTRAALLLVPMAFFGMILPPFVGRLVDKGYAKFLSPAGFICMSVGLVWLSIEMTPNVAIWRLLLPGALLGVANGLIWSPVSSTATRNLAPQDAGAGAGVYNITRQIGAVLGSAAVGAFLQSRLLHEMRGPKDLAGFSTAMGQSLLLPAALLIIAIVASAFFQRPGAKPARQTVQTTYRTSAPA